CHRAAMDFRANALERNPMAMSPADQPQVPICNEPDPKLFRIESLISTLLRVGVILSLSIVVAGILLTFFRHPEYRDSADELNRLTQPGAAFPHTLRAVAEGMAEGHGQAFVMLGLILLIATPIVRVA